MVGRQDRRLHHIYGKFFTSDLVQVRGVCHCSLLSELRVVLQFPCLLHFSAAAVFYNTPPACGEFN